MEFRVNKVLSLKATKGFNSVSATSGRYSSVQFSSRWYLCARKSPYAIHPVSHKHAQHCLWNGSNVRLIDDSPLSSFQGRSSNAFLFPRLSPPGDRWCHALGFVHASRVWSCSTLQIFREASKFWGLLCPPVCLLGYFPSLRHVQGITPAGVFGGGCWLFDTVQSWLPIPFFIICSKLIQSVRMMACMVPHYSRRGN